MDRYHDEYYRLKDRHAAIVASYSYLFAPAIASNRYRRDRTAHHRGSPIPLIQKIAIFASLSIVSIFISVVTLHPVILSYIQPAQTAHASRGLRSAFGSRRSSLPSAAPHLACTGAASFHLLRDVPPRCASVGMVLADVLRTGLRRLDPLGRGRHDSARAAGACWC